MPKIFTELEPMNQLLLGCGHSRQKKMGWPITGWKREWDHLFTLDNNSLCDPDVVMDLDSWNLGWATRRGLKCINEVNNKLVDDFFDEVHAYEVLEHLGRQGDTDSFFNTFSNLYRILVNGGLLLASCPSRYSGWLWGDPGHRRVIIPESLSFLDATIYEKECGLTSRSDYRDIWKGDFECLYSGDDKKTTHAFILKAHKPPRIFNAVQP
jgi:hypothetical protein